MSAELKGAPLRWFGRAACLATQANTPLRACAEVRSGPHSLHMSPGHASIQLGEVQTHSIAWSPDGSWLAAGCGDGALRLFELRTERVWSLPVAPGQFVSATAWRPGTGELACSSGNSVWFTEPRARLFRRVVHADNLDPGSLAW